jgi:hypothetical protein
LISIIAESCANGGRRRVRIRADAAGDDRRNDALLLHRVDEALDVLVNVDHHDVGAAPGAQQLHGFRRILRVQDLGALVEGDLCCGGKLAREISDDQNTHGFSSRRPSS